MERVRRRGKEGNQRPPASVQKRTQAALSGWAPSNIPPVRALRGGIGAVAHGGRGVGSPQDVPQTSPPAHREPVARFSFPLSNRPVCPVPRRVALRVAQRAAQHALALGAASPAVLACWMDGRTEPPRVDPASPVRPISPIGLPTKGSLSHSVHAGGQDMHVQPCREWFSRKLHFHAPISSAVPTTSLSLLPTARFYHMQTRNFFFYIHCTLCALDWASVGLDRCPMKTHWHAN